MKNFEQRRTIGFRPQEQALSMHIERLLSEQKALFDKHNYFEYPELGVGISKQQEDGTFFVPEFFLGNPIPLTHDNDKYQIYQM